MVAIKDMEMPSCCMNCGVLGKEEMYCSLYPRRDLDIITVATTKPDWCPLVEIEERKVGKWIVNKDTICCPFCSTRQKIGAAEVELLDTIFTGFKFCKHCGAELRGANNE